MVPQSAYAFAVVSLVVIVLIVVYHAEGGPRDRDDRSPPALLLGRGHRQPHRPAALRRTWWTGSTWGSASWRFWTYNIADAAITTSLILIFVRGHVPRPSQSGGAMTEPGPRAAPPEDATDEVDGDEDLEGALGLEPAPPSVAPGPRRLASPRRRCRAAHRPLRGGSHRALALLRSEADQRRAAGGRHRPTPPRQLRGPRSRRRSRSRCRRRRSRTTWSPIRRSRWRWSTRTTTS